MSAAKLNKRLKITEISNTSDGMGGTIGVSVVVDEIWGQVNPLSGSRLLEAQQINKSLSHEITIRHQGYKFKKEYLIEYDGRIFVPHAIINTDEKSKEYKILAQERL